MIDIDTISSITSLNIDNVIPDHMTRGVEPKAAGDGKEQPDAADDSTRLAQMMTMRFTTPQRKTAVLTTSQRRL